MADTELRTRLTLADNLTQGLRRAQTNVKGFTQQATRALGGLRTAFAGVAAFGLTRLVTSTARAVDEVGKLSDRLGLSTEFLSDFTFAAGQAGIEANTVEKALQRVTRRFGELAEFGRGEAKPAIDALSAVLGEDLEARIRAGENFADLLPDIARGLSQITDESRRLAIAFKLFDTEGAPLVQLLGQGAGNVNRLLGANPNRVREADARAAAAFNDELDRFGKTLAGLNREVLTPLLPVLTSVVEEGAGFVRWLRDVAGVVDAAQQARQRAGQGRGGFLPPLLGPGIPAPPPGGGSFLNFVGPRLPVGGLPPEVDRPRLPGPAPFDPNAFVGPIDRSGFIAPGIGQMPLRRAVEPAKELRTEIDGLTAGVEDLTQAFSGFNVARQAIIEVGFALTDNISAELDAIAAGTKRVEQAFSDMALSILADLRRILIQAIITRAVGAAFGGIGGLLTSSTTDSQAIANAGGNVNSGGATGMLVRPGTMRTVRVHGGRRGEAIVPLDRHVARGGMGGGTTIIMNVSAIDAQSFDERFLGSAARQGSQLGAVVIGAARQSPRLRRSMAG